jgi:RNA polymerase sigma-70 factor (ECF subfamily)
MDETARLRWIASQILPYESEVRGWLVAHAASLNSSDIDDIVQEAYSRLWTANLTGIANARAYFYTVIRNLVAERARRARVVPMERMGEIEALRIVSEEPSPERYVGARQELARLMKLIGRLPAQCRRAFELRTFEGMSQRQIAGLMGISEKTVEKHLAKALLRVMNGMDDAKRGSRTSPGALKAGRHDRRRRGD